MILSKWNNSGSKFMEGNPKYHFYILLTNQRLYRYDTVFFRACFSSQEEKKMIKIWNLQDIDKIPQKTVVPYVYSLMTNILNAYDFNSSIEWRRFFIYL